jgi:hypothetical protein
MKNFLRNNLFNHNFFTFEKLSFRLIHGQKKPKMPLPPDPESCCENDCVGCVHVMYEKQKTKYLKYLSNLEKNGVNLSVDEKNFIKSNISSESAFDKLEKKLKKKG